MYSIDNLRLALAVIEGKGWRSEAEQIAKKAKAGTLRKLAVEGVDPKARLLALAALALQQGILTDPSTSSQAISMISAAKQKVGAA